MLSDQRLMELHVEALFTHDASQRLLTVNEPHGNGALAPRFFLGRTQAGSVRRFRSDVPDPLVEQLEVLCADEKTSGELLRKPQHFEKYIRLLQSHATIQELWMGPAYRVPVEATPPAHAVGITDQNADLLRGGFEWLIPRIEDEQPCLAIVREGAAVSICRSVRITSRAHEAGVETLDVFRRRGYASEVVIGWARAVHEMGCVPLFSTSWENVLSQGVARKLALALYGVTFHVK